MQLLVAAYPILAEKGMQQVEAYRQQHDPLYKVIAPHFTFVFPLTGINEAAFVAEIAERAKGSSEFSFVLRCATVSKDSFSDAYHLFLVPDDGYSHIVKLHNRLYDGSLLQHRRFDIDYTPHISIGRSHDLMEMKRLADEWNSKNISIAGKVDMLEILSYDGVEVKRVRRVVLE